LALVRVDDVRRIELGTFVRPPQESGTAGGRVETVLGYLARTPRGLLLLDTGLGLADEETEDWYRPRRIRIDDALRTTGVAVEDVDVVVNCHLHFDHIGGNPWFAGRPILCQRGELETARTTPYTVPELVDFDGARYELLDGEAEIAPGVHVVPTPGHVDGHQSVVLECEDGSLVLAGQAHDVASGWSADVLAARAPELGHEPPLPTPSPWMHRLLEFDPKRVVFAHDHAVWTP
jgi:N-acyl homoserine lactone hydrolase